MMSGKIRQLRKRAGWTQDQLAELIGASKAHVSEMENGKKNPSRPMLEKLALHLGVRPSDLIDDDAVIPTSDDLEILERIHRLSPEAQAEARRFLLFLESQADRETSVLPDETAGPKP